MEINSIDHEHEFKTLKKSQDPLKMLKCNDLTLNHKSIYFTFCYLFFTLIQFTGFYLYTTHWSCKQCHMKHVGIVYISGRSLLLSGYLVMFKAFFSLLWDRFGLEERVVFLCLGLLVFRVRFRTESMRHQNAQPGGEGGGGISSWAYFLRQTA